MADGLKGLYADNSYVREVMDNPSLTPSLAAHLLALQGFQTSERAVRRMRQKPNRHTPAPGTRKQAPVPEEGTGTADQTSDSITFDGVVLERPIVNNDWTHVFEKFHLDPEGFEIVGDTVRMKTWQQSKALEDGTRDVIQLYSYGARFRRIVQVVTDDEIAAAQERARNWVFPRRTPGSGLGPPVSVVLNLADLQIGKSEGGGVAATMDRIESGIERFQDYVDVHRTRGVNLDEIIIVNNGDPYEGTVAGNYASQLFTVEMNLRAQMNTVLDIWTGISRMLYPQFDNGQHVSVHCNHTQLGRIGGKDSITSDSDGGGPFLSETLKRILHSRPDMEHIKFTIPHDEMSVFTETTGGVTMGFNHGHKIPGNDATGFEKWLNGQVRGDRRFDARVWVTAHKHNFQAWDLGSTFVLQCPSCDGGSKWLRDTGGKFSNAGMVSLLVGQHHPLGWSDIAFL